MKNILDTFCDIFPTIDFDIKCKPVKHQLSVESRSTGDKEIRKMLNSAKKDLSNIRRSHKQGKASVEEVFDYEWRVQELEEQLERFNNSTMDPDDDLLEY